MKIYCMVIFIMLFMLTGVLSAQEWKHQNSNTSINLSGLIFFNANTGIVIGNDGIIVKTTSGGEVWTPIQLDSTQNGFYDICIISDSSAIIAAKNGILYKTTNRGAAWKKINLSFTYDISLIEFFDSTTGVLVISPSSSINSLIYKSTDAGNSWALMSDDPEFDIWGIGRASDSTIFLAASNLTHPTMQEQSIKKLSKMSSSIEEVYKNHAGWTFFDISFNNIGIGYAGGTGNSAYTTNAGLNWSDGEGWASKVELQRNFGYVIRNFSIFKTNNSGLNWFLNYSGNVFLNDIYFGDSNTCYVVGNGGIILRNSDISSSIFIGEIPVINYHLSQNYPNPFNPSTRIKFAIPKASLVKLTVYDILGRQVAEMVNQSLNAGVYEYEWSGAELSSGIYFYKLESGDFTQTKRMVLVK